MAVLTNKKNLITSNFMQQKFKIHQRKIEKKGWTDQQKT